MGVGQELRQLLSYSQYYMSHLEPRSKEKKEYSPHGEIDEGTIEVWVSLIQMKMVQGSGLNKENDD